MSATITSPGISFTLKNNCDSPVRGLSVGNRLYLLEVGSATFRTSVFFGDLEPGEEVQLMAASDFEGKADLLFVQINCGSAVVTATANETVSVPDRYCGCSGEYSQEHLKVD